MLSYLQAQLFGTPKAIPSIQTFDNILNQLEKDNNKLNQEISQYEEKIMKLPSETRRKITERQGLMRGSQLFPDFAEREIFEEGHEQRSPRSPQIYTSIMDRSLLQQKLKSLEVQQKQIKYISKLSDTYIRCKRQEQPSRIFTVGEGDVEQSIQSMRQKFQYNKSTLQKQQLELMSQFIEQIKPYHPDQQQGEETIIINQLITGIKQHTSKKLIQKCENFVHFGPNNNTQKIIIEKFLIKNCKDIILAENKQKQVSSLSDQFSDKKLKIVNKFIDKILGQVIQYDVSSQKILLMQVVVSKEIQGASNKQQEVIFRKRVQFLPTQTEKHFQEIKFTLEEHIGKVDLLRSLLCDLTQTNFSKKFDKIVQKYVSLIKSTLQYILPYLNIKSRKQLMSVLAHGKDETIEFQDLILRLKFKGQDGEMFMNNLEAVFARLVEIRNDENKQEIKVNEKNFQTLASFFELGISQAEQSLLESSSKAIKKFTTNISMRNKQKSLTSKHTSKKLLNMIFFSVTNLIERFDETLDGNFQTLSNYNEELKCTLEQKVNEWVTKLIEIRQNVRRRIHDE